MKDAFSFRNAVNAHSGCCLAIWDISYTDNYKFEMKVWNHPFGKHSKCVFSQM